MPELDLLNLKIPVRILLSLMPRKGAATEDTAIKYKNGAMHLTPDTTICSMQHDGGFP
jgi:hypothetical protein